MRRPHVYERSAPRSSRSAYHEPVADQAAASRDIAATLVGLLARAEAAGLSTLSALLHPALQEADLQARKIIASSSAIDSRLDHEPPSRAEVEGLLRVLDASAIVAQPEV